MRLRLRSSQMESSIAERRITNNDRGKATSAKGGDCLGYGFYIDAVSCTCAL